ncbi:MAG: DUF1211 domain-containing protein [Fimbriimonadaceae bacterium]|nr:DUF1211 domain-containing protein [Chitinophagales bacterium]
MQASTSRVEAFSDGVMAIIITIMVLGLNLPAFNKDQTTSAILDHVTDLISYFSAYVVSFTMIGILWTNHHHLFHLLEKTNGYLLAQNLFFLFWMSLIPFGTGIMGSSPLLPVSTAFYGFIMFMTTLSFAFMRSYTIKKHLVHTDIQREITKKIYKVSVRARTMSYIAAGVYFLSIPLAFVSVYISYACFIIPIIFFILPDGIDNEKLGEKMIEKNS